MAKADFTEDFKRDAALQTTERGYPVAEVAARLGIGRYSLYDSQVSICSSRALTRRTGWPLSFASSAAKGSTAMSN